MSSGRRNGMPCLLILWLPVLVFVVVMLVDGTQPAAASAKDSDRDIDQSGKNEGQ